MSQENVEALRTAYEQFARGDFGAWTYLRDDCEFVTHPEMPDAGTYRGDAARRWLQAWVDSFERLTVEGTEFIDAGDKVVVAILQRGVPRGSQTPVEGRWWQVLTIRDEALVRIETLSTRAEALEAAGLSE